MNTVQPLQEHRTLFTHIVTVLLMTAAVRKLVTVIQPLGLYQHLKTLRTQSESIVNVLFSNINLTALTLSDENKRLLKTPGQEQDSFTFTSMVL